MRCLERVCPFCLQRAFSLWPRSWETQWPVATSHTRRVQSQEPETQRVVPSAQTVHTCQPWRGRISAEPRGREEEAEDKAGGEEGSEVRALCCEVLFCAVLCCAVLSGSALLAPCRGGP